MYINISVVNYCGLRYYVVMITNGKLMIMLSLLVIGLNNYRNAQTAEFVNEQHLLYIVILYCLDKLKLRCNNRSN